MPLPQEYPEGVTSLAGPLATLTKLQWLDLRYCPLAACGGGAMWTGVALGGLEAWRRGNADGFSAREGGNTLRFATSIPPLCRAQTTSFPTPLPQPPITAGTPPRRRRNALGSGSASALAASLARLGGLSYLNFVALAALPARLGSLSYLNLGVAGRRKASRYYFDYFDY